MSLVSSAYRLVSGCLLLSLLVCVGPHGRGDAVAQSAPVAPEETVAPIGPAKEAVVGLIVVAHPEGGAATTRYANGLLLRSDGFVLAPSSLFPDPGRDPDTVARTTHIEVVLAPGTPEELHLPARFPTVFSKIKVGDGLFRMPYTVLTFDKRRRPAARTLLPTALEENAPLTVAWSAWDPTTAKFLPVQSAPAVLKSPLSKELFADVSGDSGKTHDPETVVGTLALVQPIPNAMLGAVVIGPETLAVGQVTSAQAAQSGRFTSFEHLDRVTNCITALSSTDAGFPALAVRAPFASPPSVAKIVVDGVEEEASSGDPTSEASGDAAATAEPEAQEGAQVPSGVVVPADMVYVPGGPVHLLKGLLDFQPELRSREVAFVAPFLMDRYEVTNAQYLAFWKALPAVQQKDPKVQKAFYPLSWTTGDPPFPKDLSGAPVLGTPLSGAKAYARWLGKRLPTPFEWCLAAFGPQGGTKLPKWVQQYALDRQKVGERVVAAHLDYVRDHPDLLPRTRPPATNAETGGEGFGKAPLGDSWDPAHPRPLDFARLPWFFRTARYHEAARWSQETVLRATDPLWRKWIDPLYVLPVGSRRFDVSPYGVHDMILNGAELVAQGAGEPYTDPARREGYPADPDRYVQVELDAPNDYPAMLQRVQAGQFLPNDFGLWGVREHWAPYPTDGLGETPGAGMINIDLNCRIAGYPHPHFGLEEAHGMNDLTGSPYWERIPSRRLLTGAMQSQGDPIESSWSDQKDWTTVCASLGEASAMLAPIGDIRVELLPGPRYQQQFWPGGPIFSMYPAFGQNGLNGIDPEEILPVLLKNTVPATGTFIPRGSSRAYPFLAGGRSDVGHFYPLGGPFGEVWLDGVHGDIVADSTFIDLMDSFGLWNRPPRHLHREMAREAAQDVNRPPHLFPWVPNGTPGGKSKTIPYPISLQRPPDVYLLAGGFRCVR